jgi:DNA-binding LytR/AlgR family response regulator
MNKKLKQLLNLLKDELGLFLSISFGIFLFVLFFQPFPISRFDIDNMLLFEAGLAGIIFLFIVLIRITFPWLIENFSNSNYESLFPSYMGGFIILVLSSVSFAFYLFYVGSVDITFYIMFKVAVICMAPPIILKVYDVVKELQQQNDSLILEKKLIQLQVEKYEEDYLNISVGFSSENSNEKLDLLIADVAFIKSADNYVEIVYKEGENFMKKLLRNTLKNIEQQIKPYSNFIRCHRICIVNKHYIEKLTRNYSSHWLIIKGYDEHIPVSRQYLLKLKEIF